MEVGSSINEGSNFWGRKEGNRKIKTFLMHGVDLFVEWKM